MKATPPLNDSYEVEELMRLSTIFDEIMCDSYILYNHDVDSVLHVTKSFTQLTGISQEEADSKKNKILMKLIHPSDFKLLKMVHTRTMEIIDNFFLQESLVRISFSYNFRIKNAEGEYTHINAFFKPTYFTESGKPRISIVMIKPSHKKGHDRFVIYIVDDEKKLYFSSGLNNYVKPDKVELSEKEIEILRYISKGFNEVVIAKKLNAKIDLIKYYKKNIFKKIHVNNIQEAVYIGLFYGLI